MAPARTAADMNTGRLEQNQDKTDFMSVVYI